MSDSFWELYWTGSMPEQSRRRYTVSSIVRADLDCAVLGSNVQTFAVASMAAKSFDTLHAQWINEMDSVYRVRVDPNTRKVEVVCLGIDSVDNEAEGIYDNTSALPDWMQDKLAVLSIMKVDPPQTKIEGVGMRVDQNVFWVLKK